MSIAINPEVEDVEINLQVDFANINLQVESDMLGGSRAGRPD
jgi:hypothetical protein